MQDGVYLSWLTKILTFLLRNIDFFPQKLLGVSGYSDVLYPLDLNMIFQIFPFITIYIYDENSSVNLRLFMSILYICRSWFCVFLPAISCWCFNQLWLSSILINFIPIRDKISIILVTSFIVLMKWVSIMLGSRYRTRF